MTKAELLSAVQDKVDNLNKKQTSEVVDAVFEALAEAIRDGERFSYPGFGTFTKRLRKARQGHNPRTGEPIEIPQTYTVSFKPAPKLKESINK